MIKSSMSNKFSPWIIVTIAFVALIGAGIWCFVIASPEYTQIDWDMQGTLVTTDGQVLETLAFSLSGKIEKDPQERDTLRLNITLPEDFDYMISEEPTVFYSAAEAVESVPYYICGETYCLNRDSSAMTLVELALSEQQEFVILYFQETPGTFLVASTNKAVTPQQILGYFDFFVKQQDNLQKVDWDLQGALITENGEVKKYVSFSIYGTLPQEYEVGEAVQSDLEIIWPDDFKIANEGQQTYFGYADDWNGSPLFCYAGYCINAQQQSSCKQQIYICPQEQFVIFEWGNNQDDYLIASTDPNADLAALFAEFREFEG